MIGRTPACLHRQRVLTRVHSKRRVSIPQLQFSDQPDMAAKPAKWGSLSGGVYTTTQMMRLVYKGSHYLYGAPSKFMILRLIEPLLIWHRNCH
jgi:hypothetical protein